VVEEVTVLRYRIGVIGSPPPVTIATVMTDAGPRMLVRLDGPADPGDVVTLSDTTTGIAARRAAHPTTHDPAPPASERTPTMIETRTSPMSRVIAALEAGRADDDVFAHGCVSWHNFDEAEVPTVPDSFEGLRAVHRVVADYRMADVVVHDTDADVSYAQFVLTGTLPDGAALRAPGVLVAHTRGGRVVRLEEYLDTGQLSRVFALLAEQV